MPRSLHDRLLASLDPVQYTDELTATGCYPSRHNAMLEAQRRNPHLDPTPPGVKPMKPTAHASGGTAEQQLNPAARQIAAAKHITLAQAYAQAVVENQHPHPTGAR